MEIKMKFSRVAALASISLLATSAALKAQESAPSQLDRITIITDGEENIEATGGTEVTQEDLEKIKPTNTSELFQRESSVSVSGGGGPAKRIHVLGMEQSNLAVSVDGVPQVSTSWHHTGSTVIDPVFLKRVEVEAGAAAADSGFAAAAGAVRYETVGALDLLDDGKNLGARLGVSYGTNGKGFSSTAAAYGREGGFDWFIMGHGDAGGGNYDNGAGLEIKGTEPAARNILAKLGYEVNDQRFEVSYERSRDKADRLVKMNLGLAGDGIFPIEVARDSVKFSYTSTNPTDLWDPEIMVYYSKNDYSRPDYHPSTNGDMRLGEALYGGKVQNTFSIDPGTIAAGVDFGQHDYSTDNYGDAAPAWSAGAPRRYRNFSTFQAGAFTQGRFEFDNGISLSSGARYDVHIFEDWDNKQFSDSGGSINGTISYKFNDHVEIFAGASHTWLGYVIGDYAYVHARNDGFITDPNFGGGTAQNLKAGVNFGGGDWKAGVTLFDTRIKGMPEYAENVLRNLPGEFRSRGVTANASYNFASTTIGATYTYADVTFNGGAIPPNSGPFMPIGSMATLYVDHEFVDHNLKVGANLAWAGKVGSAAARAAGFPDQPAYTVVNAYAEWSPPVNENISLRVGIDNLFDETYYERSGYAFNTNRGGIQPVYAPGRTFTFSTAITF
jgi:hemoglobin/transferrin/lactoferrin receptor protein